MGGLSLLPSVAMYIIYVHWGRGGGINFVNFAEMKISCGDLWRPVEHYFGVSVEVFQENSLRVADLIKMICPQQKQMEVLDRGLKEEKQRMYMHVCFLFVDCGRLGPLTFELS